MGRRRNTEQPIIIKKGKKADHGFHGGNWKVALADFMTTMFIFFLMMWLLNIVSEEQRQSIADYFSPASVSKSSSGSGGVLGGQTITVDGTFVNPGGPPQIVPGAGQGENELPPLDLPPSEDEPLDLTAEHLELIRQFIDAVQGQGQGELAAQQAAQAAGAGGAGAEITIPVDESTEVIALPDGLKIILRDLEDEPMFASGSDQPTPRTVEVLQQIAPVAAGAGHNVRIVGHTDGVPYRAGPTGAYSNWELSADRANAARRVLVRAGLPVEQVFEVTGKGPSEPMNLEDPRAAENRRLELIFVFPKAPTATAGGPPLGQPGIGESPLPPDALQNGITGAGTAPGPASGIPRSLQSPTRLAPSQPR